MQSFVSAIIRWRWWLLALVLGATLALTPYLKPAMVANNALSVWFLDDDPLLEDYYDFHDQFANDEIILLKLKLKSSVYSNKNMQLLQGLTDQLSQVDGVFQVHSLLSVQDSINTGGGLSFEYLIPEVDAGTEFTLPESQWRQIATEAKNNTLVHKRFIDDSETQAMIWVEPIATRDYDQRRADITRLVTAVSEAYLDKNIQSITGYGLGGLSVLYTALNDITQAEAGVFFSLAYVLMLIAMVMFMRRWKVILAALSTIGLASTLAFGVYGLLGHQLNLLTVMLPTIVMIIGLTDLIHFPVAHALEQQAHPQAPAKTLAINSIKKVLLPCFLTTLTTTLGFLSLSLSPMTIIQEYAIFTALGIALAFVIGVVLMAITLSAKQSLSLPRLQIIYKQLDLCARLLINYPKQLAAVFVCTFIVGLWAATAIKVDTYTLGYFDDQADVVQDHHFILDGWGAYGTAEFLIKPKGDRPLDDAELLNALALFIKKVSEIPEFHRGYSLDALYQRMVHVFIEAGEQQGRKSLSPDLIEQLNLMIEGEFLVWDKLDPEFKDNFLSGFTTEDKDLGRLTFVADVVSASDMSVAINQANVIAEQTISPYAEVVLTGYAPLYIKIIDYVMSVQIKSFIYVVAMLFLVLLVWTRKPLLALVSLIPNVFPVVMMFSVMALLGVSLDIGTAIIAAIVMGISIDDTIHFLHHWLQGQKQGLSWRENINHTYRYAGRAVMLTSVLLIFGFPVLMLSELKTVYYFGLLTTVAVVSALLADLLLFPLLLRMFSSKAAKVSS